MRGNWKQAPKSREREKSIAPRQLKPVPDKELWSCNTRSPSREVVQVQRVDRTPMRGEIWPSRHSDWDGGRVSHHSDWTTRPASPWPSSRHIIQWDVEQTVKSVRNRKQYETHFRIHMEVYVRRVEVYCGIAAREGHNSTKLLHPTHEGSNHLDSPRRRYGIEHHQPTQCKVGKVQEGQAPQLQQ